MSFAARLLAIALFSTPAFAGTVSFRATDGATLSAEHVGVGELGVVLVHGIHEDRSAVADLTKSLGAAKMQVMAVDLRGNGASKGTADPLKSVADVAGAVAYLRKKGAKKIAIAGTGLGGNLAFLATSKDAEVDAAIVISPALNHNGVKASAALEGYGERPILMIVGRGDALATKAANMLGDRMSDAQIEMLEVEGSGSKLLKRDPGLPDMILSWLQERWKGEDGGQKANMKTENQELKSSGTKLGER